MAMERNRHEWIHDSPQSMRRRHGNSTGALITGLVLSLFHMGCEQSPDSTGTPVTKENSWESYEAPAPSPELEELLYDTPAIYPHKECFPYDESMPPVADEHVEWAEDGTKQICVWHHAAGCVPEGMIYAEVASCDIVRTLGPSWFIPPVQKFESNLSLLDEEEYRTELEWARSQVQSSGCACCHSSEVGGYASFWDLDTPGSWTDTLTMTGVVMAAGLADEHKYLGYLPPETNFGFDRETTILPTNDIPRMKAFFLQEFARRGGTAEDIETARKTFLQINGGLFEPATPCGPDEGMDADGRIVWNGDAARQIYIQEEGSENPGSPPTFDKPTGTVWALYANPDASGLESGTLTPGTIPSGSLQVVPEDPNVAPVLEVGQTYRLFVTPDFMRPMHANCTFTYGDAPSDAEAPTCTSADTLCATLKIPESITETPEKLVVGLYQSLPPMGPPDVFPPFSIDAPELTPGGTLDIVMNANGTGNHQIYAVLYMPGGGAASWQPASGIDHVGTSAPIVLDGSGQSLEEPIAFDLAP